MFGGCIIVLRCKNRTITSICTASGHVFGSIHAAKRRWDQIKHLYRGRSIKPEYVPCVGVVPGKKGRR